MVAWRYDTDLEIFFQETYTKHKEADTKSGYDWSADRLSDKYS